MKIKGDWLRDPRTRRVFKAVEGAGFKIFYVGGAVRNGALGLPVSDIDLATDARPDAVAKAATKAGLRVVPTGLSHGTVTVVVDGLPHEVTTFRTDIETDGRRAVVAYTDQMAEDAMRRDFTINALYADQSGEVIDLVEGLADIAARRIRFVGKPEDRVREDYLRILRFFRMYAYYADPNEGFDADGLAAVSGGAEGLEKLSAERVGHEMLRLLAAPDPAPALATMAHTGILARVLPGASADVVTRLIHFEDGAAPDALRRLAALGGSDVRDRFRLSRNAAKRLDRLRAEIGSEKGLSELAWRIGRDDAWDVAMLRAAVFESDIPGEAAAQIVLGSGANFPVRASDLAGEFEGPALGQRLAQLEAAWIASGFALTREELLSRG